MNVYKEVLPLFAEHLDNGDLEKHIEGEVISPIFRIHK
jgi:hypothetical protein